jgi:hypothetical protein
MRCCGSDVTHCYGNHNAVYTDFRKFKITFGLMRLPYVVCNIGHTGVILSDAGQLRLSTSPQLVPCIFRTRVINVESGPVF